MQLLIIDPGFGNASGHNAAINRELVHELAADAGKTIEIATHRHVDLDTVLDIARHTNPVFRLPGYRRFHGTELTDPEWLADMRAALDADLDRLEPEKADVLLLHTAYPLHLEALARRAQRLAHCRIVIGLLLPPEFWAADDDAAVPLARILGQALSTFAQAGAMIYGEHGRYTLDDACIAVPVLLPPVSQTMRDLMADLARTPDSARPLRFGFFGAPYASKGFETLVEVARMGLPEEVELFVCLPGGFEDACRTIAAFGPRIVASSTDTSNAEYLRAMAQVDVVLTHYDPAHYQERMSGIVPEAICLGRPLVVTHGCHAIIDFLDRHAPGSFVTAGFEAAQLAAALSLPRATWDDLADRARASAPLLREMKNLDRYLRITGLRPTVRHHLGSPP